MAVCLSPVHSGKGTANFGVKNRLNYSHPVLQFGKFLQFLPCLSNDLLTVSSQLWFWVLNWKTPPKHLTLKKSPSLCVLLRSSTLSRQVHFFPTIYSSILKPSCPSPSSSRTLSMSYISLPQQNLKKLERSLWDKRARYTNCWIHEATESQSNHTTMRDSVVSLKEPAAVSISDLFQCQEVLHSSWMEE